MRRVAITGLGAITAAGLTASESWTNLCAANSGISAIENIRTQGLSVPIAAQIKKLDVALHMNPKLANTMDRVSLLAVIAAREAMADAGLMPVTSPDVANASVIIGVAVGGMNTLDDSFHQVYAEAKSRVHPFTIPRLMASAPASQVTMDLGLHGNTFSIASACASGTHAIGTAFRAVRSGETVVALTGGAEACITFGTLLGWEALRVLSYDTCRPFSKNRSGLVLGEGAAMLVLEDWDHATKRGARIYAELCGFGSNADAGDLTSPDGANIARAMEMAMLDAKLAKSDVGYVNAHGTGTLINDLVEAKAVSAVFCDATPPLISSNKGVMGHCLGAAGAIEAMATALSLYHQCVPPTANCIEPDPSINLDVVADGCRQGNFAAAISNSFAFGGLNAVLALRRHHSMTG